ncbi:MAG TPA: 4'-phosphopantetheinyl transferase superfamily protein [Streptosporangiaceae bacterium]
MAAPASLTPRNRAGKLAEGTALLWWARVGDASGDQVALLDEAERARLAAYRRAADRDRFLVGCALAKTVIAACTGSRPESVSFDRACARCGLPHGKPVVAGGPQFSVAHSGALIAVAVATDPVGVDVEQLDGRARPLGGGDPEALARLVLAEPERAALAGVDPAGRARAFLVAWARKEAVAKATGDGLRAPFSKIVVAAAAGPPRVTSWPYPQAPGTVSLLDLDASPGYVAALAVLGRCQAVQSADGSALLAARGGRGGA